MNNNIKILFFVVFIFLLNIILYFFSDDYKFFVKKLKSPNENIYVNSKNINDDFYSSGNDINYDDVVSDKKSKVLEEKNKIMAKKLLQKSIDVEKKITVSERKLELEEKVKDIMEKENKKKINQEIYLGKAYLKIFDLFKEYETYKIKIHTSLFDLTSEYPNEYFEFYSEKLTIYFFPIGSYKKMYEIFNVLTYDLPFSIKEVNNFGDKSFYINLDEEVSDDYIRLVITNKGILFGIKVKKSEYNTIKKILDTNL